MKKYFLLSPLLIEIVINNYADAAQPSFDLNSLGLNSEEQKQYLLISSLNNTDLSKGEYKFQTIINGKRMGRVSVFIDTTKTLEGSNLNPTMYSIDLKKIHFNEKLNDFLTTNERISLDDLNKKFKGIGYTLNLKKSLLKVEIPHEYLRKTNTPLKSEFDSGISSLYANISASGFSKKYYNSNIRNDSNLINIQTGANYGKLRFHSQFYHNETNSTRNDYVGQNWLSYDIEKHNTRVYAGQLTSNPDIFESFDFKGFRISKASEMSGNIENSYVPEITGVADSNATVQLLQNGIVIYQTFVQPGFFSINDVYLNQTNDLTLRVTEESGKTKESIISVSSMGEMIRKGVSDFSFESGLVPKKHITKEIYFTKWDYKLGLPYDSTLISGLILSNPYRNYSLGVIKDLANYGTIEYIANNMNYHENDIQAKKGKKNTLRYDKRLSSSGSYLTIQHSQYSGEYREINNIDEPFEYLTKTSNKLNISQSFKTGASISLSYENHSIINNKKNEYYTTTFTTPFYRTTLYATISKMKYFYNHRHGSQTAFSIGINIPIGVILGGNKGSLTESYINSSTASNFNTALNETIFDDNLDVSTNFSKETNNKSAGQQNEDNYAISGTYHSSLGDLGLGYTKNMGVSAQKKWSWRNSFVLHEGGITFSPKQINPYNGTALVKIQDAKGVMIQGDKHILTDNQGYALVPNLQPYRYNNIRIKTKNQDNNIELQNTKTIVTPSQGAIVLTEFNAKVGYKTLLHLTYKGLPLPYGSYVFGNRLAMTNENGYIYLSGVKSGQLVTISISQDKSCNFKMPDLNDSNKQINIVAGKCE